MSRAFLMDGEVISNTANTMEEEHGDERKYNEDEKKISRGREKQQDDVEDEEEMYSDEDNDFEDGDEGVEYLHQESNSKNFDKNFQEEDEEDKIYVEDEVPSGMSTDFYADVEKFLNKPPPGFVKNSKKEKKHPKNNTKEGNKKGSLLPNIHDLPKKNVSCKVSTRRTPGNKKTTKKEIDEALLNQAFEYTNKLQQEAINEELHDTPENVTPLKSSSAPSLHRHEPLSQETKPHSANSGNKVTSNGVKPSNNRQRGKKKPPNGVVRRLRSKTQSNGDTFDTSYSKESATSARNVVDFQALVENFQQGTELNHLREELEKSKASMAQSRRAMQEISKEMSGKLKV